MKNTLTLDNIEKISFDTRTFVWKLKLNLFNYKNDILNEVMNLIDTSSFAERERDAYTVHLTGIDFIGNIMIHNRLHEISQFGIKSCELVYNNMFNKVSFDAWINVVRSKNPVQHKLRKKKYHIHTEIQERAGKFFPNYTYVYYIQMPDVMNGDDGVLYFRGKNKKEYWIRPEEDDLIIMEGDMPHAPNNAPNSTLDRIVLAGNVGFEFLKNFKSII